MPYNFQGAIQNKNSSPLVYELLKASRFSSRVLNQKVHYSSSHKMQSTMEGMSAMWGQSEWEDRRGNGVNRIWGRREFGVFRSWRKASGWTTEDREGVTKSSGQ